MTMDSITVRGVDIITDESVPVDQIWIDAPMEGGGKVRYMFTLNDHRLMRVDGQLSFFVQLQSRLKKLRDTINRSPIQALDELDEIRLLMEEFNTGLSEKKDAPAYG